MRELTNRRRQIIHAVNFLTQVMRYPPSGRTIGDAVGYSSTAAIAYQLGILCREGWLTRTPTGLRLGPRLAVSHEGVVAEVVRIERCEECGTDMPADHTHLNVTAAAAEAPAVAADETTPNPLEED